MPVSDAAGSSARNTIMVIEDDPMVRRLLEEGLRSEERTVLTALDCEEALSQISGGKIPEVILLDLSLPGMGGLEFLNVVRKRYPLIKAIVISANDGVDTIVQAMRQGALDFIPKPFKLEDVKVTVNEALQYRRLQVDINRNKHRSTFHDEESFLYTSSPMAAVMEKIQRVAPTTVPVLITGESGVGKELVAREIHQRSASRKGSFVKVNCAAIPANLLEGELFGYEKGAFTGAVKTKPARFERAHNGTLFLDEIGELGHDLQAKLLHALQDGSFSRLGSNKVVRSNARIVVATNRDIERAVEEGQFRSDLYYRLNVIRIHVPPLRDRPSDILFLADHFLAVSNRKFGKSLVFDEETKEYILQHDWPGNVRELQNAVSRFVVLGKLRSVFTPQGPAGASRFLEKAQQVGSAAPRKNGEEADDHGEGPEEQGHPYDGMPLKVISRNAAREAERKAILSVLHATGWNRSQAARILRVSYKALLYKIKDCGIEPQ